MELVFLSILIFCLISIGLLSYLNNPKAKSNLFFAEFLLHTSIWVLVNYYSNNFTEYTAALWMNRFIFVSTTLLFRALFLFAKAYPNTKLRISKMGKYILDFSTILVCVLALTSLIVKEISFEENHTNIIFGGGISAYLLYFAVLILAFIFVIYDKFKRSRGLERVKIQYLFLGLGLSAFGASVTNLVLPIFFDEYTLTNLGPFSLLIFVFLTFISIIKHRILGIKFVIGSVLLSLLQVGVVFVEMLIFNFISVNYLGDVSSVSRFLIQLIFVYFSLQLFMRTKDIFEDLISKVFNYETLSYEGTKNTLTQYLSTNIDIDGITKVTTDIMKEVFDMSGLYVSIYNKESQTIEHDFVWGVRKQKVKDLGLLVENYVNSSMSEDIIVKQELLYSHEDDSDARLQRILGFLNKNDYEVFFSVELSENRYLSMLIKEKVTRQAYSVQEFDLLLYIRNILSSAYSRSLLYKEVKDFTNLLQQKVDDATLELQDKVELLEEARRRERDMMDIMGHELRTPLSIIKIKQSLLRNKAKNKPDEFTTKEFLEVDEAIKEALDREIELLETMLSSTKVDAGRMELSFEPVSVESLVSDSILGHRHLASDKSLEIVVNDFDESLQIFADKVRIAEVLDNFVSNAIKYTNKGSIKIAVQEKDEMVQIAVTDTGIGIPKKALKRLGEKFYRVSQYTNGNNGDVSVVRPGGTGLGLYVAFALVRLMGGEVDVQSKHGEGSTFAFSVPKYVDQKLEVQEKQNHDVFKRLGLNKS